jgi:hypothetical protein
VLLCRPEHARLAVQDGEEVGAVDGDEPLGKDFDVLPGVAKRGPELTRRRAAEHGSVCRVDPVEHRLVDDA